MRTDHTPSLRVPGIRRSQGPEILKHADLTWPTGLSSFVSSCYDPMCIQGMLVSGQGLVWLHWRWWGVTICVRTCVICTMIYNIHTGASFKDYGKPQSGNLRNCVLISILFAASSRREATAFRVLQVNCKL